jgi:MYXO-CTERM domain-containing protein
MRTGCNIDINRNFPTAFGQRTPTACTAETTCGPSPFSEPESQALRDLAMKLPRLRFYVDYHSSGNQVMIPYAFTRDAPPGFAKNQQWGTLLAQEAKLPARPAYNLAQGAGGGALDWFREKFTESLVVELPGRGFDPPANGIAANVELQWNGWLAVAELVARENPAEGVAPPPAADAGAADAPVASDAAVPVDAAGGAGGAGGISTGGANGIGTGGANGTGTGDGTPGSGGRGNEPAGSGGSVLPPASANEFAGSGFGCAVGGRGGAGAWALVGAALLLVRRRRRA